MKTWLVGALLLAASAGAQSGVCKTLQPGPDDALVASPANHTVLYENADVRVLDVHSQPHTREAVHTHRLPSVMYILQQGAGTYDTPDGSDHRSHPTDPNFKPVFRAIKPEGPHWTENTGDVPFHAIRVEFKHPGCGLPGWKPAVPGPDDGLVAAPGGHALLFENDELRVLDVRVAAHAKEPMHTHPWPGFFYVEAVGPLIYSTPATPGTQAATMPIEKKILPVGSEGPHSVENVGDQPVHFIRFELKLGSQPSR